MRVTEANEAKNTLWIFGNSNSAILDPGIGWCRQYIGYKGYISKTFGEILSEKLNYNFNNFSLHGGDNYSIFEVFCKNIQHIKKGDWVIFGWSSLCRFRIGRENKTWAYISPMNVDNELLKNLKYISQDTLDSISLNRSNVQSLLVNEIEIWMNLIKTVLPECTLIFYTPSLDDFINTDGKSIGVQHFDVQQIVDETDGFLEDGHYSEQGHIDLAEILYQQNIK